jgi:hypothetical protein
MTDLATIKAENEQRRTSPSGAWWFSEHDIGDLVATEEDANHPAHLIPRSAYGWILQQFARSFNKGKQVAGWPSYCETIDELVAEVERLRSAEAFLIDAAAKLKIENAKLRAKANQLQQELAARPER